MPSDATSDDGPTRIVIGDPAVSDEAARAPSEIDPAPLGEVLVLDPTPVGSSFPNAGRAPVGGPVSQGRMYALAGALAVIAIAVTGIVWFERASAPAPVPDIPLDAWAPYWTLDASNDAAEERLPSMREISPFWYNATGVTDITIDPNADVDATRSFLAEARASGASIVPSIVDALPAGEMAAILADSETRRDHINTIVSFADDGDFDGIDLDYEQFAFADGRESWPETRPNWVTFVEELARRLHAEDRTLTVSIPPVYDDQRSPVSGYWVYDHGAISEHVDRIRIMAYDFSVAEPGPIAPLDFVQRSIDGVLATEAPAEKIVLGLPVYGRNWAVGATGDCSNVELEGNTSVNARTVDDLIELREALPVFDVETGEWSFDYDLEVRGTTCVQQRRVHYVDGDGVRLRMDLARESRLGGVALWAFGFDDEAVWDEILPSVTEN